ncbi:MAG: thiamine pyrophosphate-dependent dehydrogenase E1 component subunit alpha [Bdellovibrionota bacterium]
MGDRNKNQDLIRSLYASALRIRMVEDAIAKEYPKGEMKTPIHLYTGEEAIAAGVCAALTKEDVVYAYYRSHGWYLAKGGNLNRMIDELFGKATGCSKGYGGSMHLIDLDVGFQGTTALVAGAMPHAVGAAFTMKYKKQHHVAISAFGDAATEEGLFQESLMFASLRKLPAIFICENNGLATNTLIQYRQPDYPIYKRAAGFGLESVQVDGNDAVAVYEAMNEAVIRAREGGGPTFIECLTYRVLEHCGPNSDVSLGFRTQEEVDAWKKRDPIVRLEQHIDAETKAQLIEQNQREIQVAFEGARRAPFPTSLIPEGYQCL